MTRQEKKGTILPPSEINQEIFQRYVEKCLRRIKNGEGYIMFGLNEGDDLGHIIHCEDASVTKKFLTFIGKTMEQELGQMVPDCKAKQYVKAIMEKLDYIALIGKAGISMTEKGDVGSIEVPSDATELGKGKDNLKQPKKTTATKRKSASSTTKPPITDKQTSNISNSKAEKIFLAKKKNIEELRAAHEEGKASVMREIPTSYKKHFNQIAFSKWSTQPYRPVLIVDPYCLSFQCEARIKWMRMFEQTRGRRDDMTFLLYWYGTDDLNSAFTFTTKKTPPIWHDDAEGKGYIKKLEEFTAKIENDSKKMKLAVNQEIVNGFKEYLCAKNLAPEERIIYSGFREEFEFLAESDLDLQQLDEVDNFAEQNEEELISTTVTEDTGKVKKKVKKSKLETEPDKRKKGERTSTASSVMEETTGFADYEVSTDQFVSDAHKDNHSEKKMVKKGGKNKTFGDQAKDERGPALPPNGDLPSKLAGIVADITDFADNDLDDVDDLSASDPGEEYDNDDDFGMKKVKKGKTFKKLAKKLKNIPASKADEALANNDTKIVEKKAKIDRKRKKKEGAEEGAKDSLNELLAKKTKVVQGDQAREQLEFDSCEKNYGALIARWEKALAQERYEAIKVVFGDLANEVEKMSAPFIELYGIPALLKKSKTFFESDEKKAYYNTVRMQFKTHHAARKITVPVGFKPTKRVTSSSVESGEKESYPEPMAVEKASPKHEEDAPMLQRQITADGTTPIAKKENVPQSIRAEHVSTSGPKSLDRDFEKKLLPLPKKARLSLGEMLKSQSFTPQDSAATTVLSSSVVETKSSEIAWLTAVPAIDSGLNGTRTLALEFFKEAAARLKSDKLNPDSVVRSIEKAIYEWSQSKPKKEETYWKKVHCIIAAICGKYGKPGGLAHKISNGDFKRPQDILDISDDVLLKCFNGEGY